LIRVLAPAGSLAGVFFCHFMKTFLCFEFLILGFCVELMAQQPGLPLPRWQEGQLDIHQISTGQGNATFAILPDGTTFLIDAGAISPLDWQTGKTRNLPRKPNGTRQPGEWIARYIRKALSFEPNPRIDYALLTHFHDDHMGSPVMAPRKPQADYALAGMTEVAEYILIRKLLDRGWPFYDFPRSFAADSMVANYRRFVAWQTQHAGLQMERFEAGRLNQIRLVHQPNAYKELFSIQNIAVNGEVWTGEGEKTRSLFPDLTTVSAAQYPTENMCSAVLRIRYGAFDYFSGGDIPGVLRFGLSAWHDMESPIAAMTDPVDVLLMNHHGHEDSQNGTLLTNLRPRVLVIPVWHFSHSARSVLERVFDEQLYKGQRDVFATDLPEATRVSLSNWTARLTSTTGHVVVRVARGGATYQVFVLDDTNEEQRVITSFGPFQSQ
jgi:beta-lactamase superfamily II metal-dependent hydrolase